MGMSSVGAGLLAGFGGALGAKEQDYQQAKKFGEAMSLEEYKLTKQKELATFKQNIASGLGDIEHTRKTEAATKAHERDLEKTNIMEGGKDRRASMNASAIKSQWTSKQKSASLTAATSAVDDAFNEAGAQLSSGTSALKWSRAKDFDENWAALRDATTDSDEILKLETFKRSYDSAQREILDVSSMENQTGASDVYDSAINSITEGLRESFGIGAERGPDSPAEEVQSNPDQFESSQRMVVSERTVNGKKQRKLSDGTEQTQQQDGSWR